MQEEIGKACMTMSSECSKALKKISTTIKAMACSKPCYINIHIGSSKEAMEKLKIWLDSDSVIRRGEKLPELVSVATVGALLGGIVECTEEIAEAANELACLARFEGAIELCDRGNEVMLTEGKNSEGCTDHVVIAVPECITDDGDLNSIDNLEMNGQNVEV